MIHALRRKPQALLNLVYRDQLFPRAAFRQAWDALLAAGPPRAACGRMVGLLALAHERACETELAAELEPVLTRGELPDLDVLQARFGPAEPALLPITVSLPSAVSYDALLGGPGAPVRSCALSCQVCRAPVPWAQGLGLQNGCSTAELRRSNPA